MAISFKGAHFPQDIILMGVRWYLAYPLSYRHVEELLEERGVPIDHATIQRWVVKYMSLSRFAAAAHVGAAHGEPGSPPTSAADRPCQEECQALSQRQRPQPPIEGRRSRSDEGPLLCPP
jgi:hypothetical protein